MPSAFSSARSTALAVSATALSAALLFAATGLHPVWWLVWLAPVPVIWIAARRGPRSAGALAALAWAIGATNQWSYYRSLQLPVPVMAFAIAAPALLFGLAVALLRVFARRGAPLRAALAPALVWVSYELVQSRTASQGTFGSLAYTQAENLPVVQLASVLGISGITFALLFFAGATAVLLTGTVPWRRRLRLLAAAAAAAAATLGFGLWRLRSEPPARSHATVGLATSDLRENVFTERADGDGRVLRDYLSQAEELTRRGAQLVVLPEKLAAVAGSAPGEVDAAYQALVDRTRSVLVAGVVRADGATRFNEARVYRSGAASPASYRKAHLLPGWESRFTPGSDRLTVSDQAGAWGLAICKDMDFPATGRAYRDDAIDLMLVPAWDFDQDGWLHARMAMLRGVEGGFGVVRSAKQGLLTVSDDRGRILAERSSTAAPFTTVLVAVPLRHERTAYARLGDAFGWANLVALAALLGSLLRRPESRVAAPSVS